MKIALIAGEKGVRHVSSGINYTIIRLYNYLKKKHKVQLIYGNLFLPNPLGRLFLGVIKDYDIVHAGSPEFAGFIYSSSPMVATFYDDIMCKPSIYLRGVQKKFDRFLFRVSKKTSKLLTKNGLRKCKKIVAISEEAKKGAIESFHVPEDKIVCIPPGIDTDTFKPLGIRKKNKKLKLFFCGGINRKGADLLLESFKLLKREMQVELTLAGLVHPTFPLRRILRRLDIANGVKYLGFVSTNKLNQLYNEADIFVMPSLFEGYGIPPLEALACGTKVVCSQMPSIEPFRDFVTITDTNPKSIAKSILETRNKNVDFVSARRKIEMEYSTQVVGEKYVRLYKKILRK